MSDPITTTLLIASAATSGVSAYGTAQAQNRAAKANAAALNKQADDEIAAARTEEAKYRAKVKALIGSQKANYAASGVDISSGTAQEIFEETQAIGNADAMTIRSNAQKKAESLRMGASAYEAGQTSSLLSGGSALLSTGIGAYGVLK